MEYAFWLYLLTRLDAFKDLFYGIAVVTFVGFLITCVGAPYIVDAFGKTTLKRTIKLFVITFLCSELICALIPSKKDAMFIAGGIGVIEAARSETAQRIASKSVGVIERFLDDMNSKTKDAK